MSSLTLEHVTKQFSADNAAVSDLNLHVPSGEFFTLLGPSGCGKTTTLRIIAGFEQPTSGAVRFGDRDVTAVAPQRRDAGMVFQNYALFPHLSVAENVSYGLKVRRVDRHERELRVTEALDAVDLGEFANRRISDLSGGQQQRVALARALVIRPRVLLLDEPLSNLDARLRDETRTRLRQLQQQSKTTAIYVTHDQAEALAVSDRIAILNQGRLHQVGTPEDVYRRPATAFVARFIGASNLVHATVTGDDEVTLPGGQRVPSAATAAPVRGQTVSVSLRPEHLRISASARTTTTTTTADDRGIRGTVASREYLGTHTLVKVNTAEGPLSVSVAEPTAPSLETAIGAHVHVLLDASAAAWVVAE